jgi:DNA (cytosine-5)-methyltransferase 1
VAGKRKGLAGARTGLWWEFHRILAEFKPGICVIENVPGLFSVNGGRDFLIIIRGLAELGYCVSWAVLDSQYRGVAQRRDRVFIVGSLGNGCSAQILFESESVCGDSAPSREKRQSIAGPLGGSAQSGGFRTTDLDNSGAFIPQIDRSLNSERDGYNDGSDQNYVADCLQERDSKGPNSKPKQNHLIACFDERSVTCRDNRQSATPDRTQTLNESGGMTIAFSGKDHGQDALKDLSPTLRSMQHIDGNANGGGQVSVAIPIQEIGKRQSGTPQNGVGYGKAGDPMFTLQRSAEHGVVFQSRIGRNGRGQPQPIAPTLSGASSGATSDMRPCITTKWGVRRLTPRECERLQGFPDDFTRWDGPGKEISDSARYRMLGNAVTVPIARWLGQQIRRFA